MLNYFSCSNNNLTYLNVKNGNNINFTNFSSEGNIDLHCIYVDDVAWSITNWTNIDATSNFVADQAACDALYIGENELAGLNVYPNPVKDNLHIQAENQMDRIEIYNMFGQLVLTQKPILKNVTLDLTKLVAGNYILKIQANNQVATFKIT